jgi:hypothetical protein
MLEFVEAEELSSIALSLVEWIGTSGINGELISEIDHPRDFFLSRYGLKVIEDLVLDRRLQISEFCIAEGALPGVALLKPLEN